MPSITRMFLITRAISFALDKYFDAKGKSIREKAASAEGELGPELSRDLRKLAIAEEAGKLTRGGSSRELEATVERVWRGLRSKKPEVAAAEAEAAAVEPPPVPEPVVVETPAPAQRAKAKEEGSGWMTIAMVLLFIAIALSATQR